MKYKVIIRKLTRYQQVCRLGPDRIFLKSSELGEVTKEQYEAALREPSIYFCVKDKSKVDEPSKESGTSFAKKVKSFNKSKK